MALAKQAKILTKAQQDAVLGLIASSRYPLRNRVIFLLSVKAGLRAKEIASLTWAMVTDVEGNVSDSLTLTNIASKGNSGGRAIPMSRDLRAAISNWKVEADSASRQSSYVVTTERSPRTSSYAVVNLFADWYHALGFVGASMIGPV